MRKTDWVQERCAGCSEQIKFGEKTGLNGAWHARCWKAHEEGAATAKRYIDSLLRTLDFPSTDEMQAMIGYSSAVIIETPDPGWTKSEPLMHDRLQMSYWDGLKFVPAFVRGVVERPHPIQVA